MPTPEKLELIETPQIGPDEALVYVMAAGVNYNNVWAGLGTPIDVLKNRAKVSLTLEF